MIGIMGRIFWSRGGRPQEKISITKEENRHNHVFGPIFLDIPIFFKGDAKNYRFLSLSKFCTNNSNSDIINTRTCIYTYVWKFNSYRNTVYYSKYVEVIFMNHKEKMH